MIGLQLKMNILTVILVLFGSLLAIAGLSGICFFTVYTILPGPFYLRNNFIGIWLSLLHGFLSLELIYCVVKSTSRISSMISTVFNVVYYISIALGSLFISLGYASYALVERVDSYAMCLVIMLISVISIVILLIRRKSLMKQKPETINKKCSQDTSEIEAEIEQSTSLSNFKLFFIDTGSFFPFCTKGSFFCNSV